MKTPIAVSALFLASNLVFAETFTYERQVASQDRAPNIPKPAPRHQQPHAFQDSYADVVAESLSWQP